MQNKIILTLAVIVFSFLAHAEEARHETATAEYGATNTISIADYETGELIDLYTDSYANIHVIKDGFLWGGSPARQNSSGRGTTMRGPAVFRLSHNGGPSANHPFMTVKITPVSFPPDKTLIVPPGTNQVQISLETSTNLINWQTATNGVYGSPTTVQFFRLKETKLN